VDTADRSARAELTEGNSPAEVQDAEAVLEAFAAERLLILAAGTVEISHDVLLTARPLLRDTWARRNPQRPDRPHLAAQHRRRVGTQLPRPDLPLHRQPAAIATARPTASALPARN
jgi:hypothetical protein